MKELTAAQYDSVRPLLAPFTHYLTPDAILAGLTPGRVFADDPDAPQTAVAWYGHRAFVVGRADEQARQQMAGWWQGVVLHEKARSGLGGLVAWQCWVDLNYRLGQEPSLHGAADHLLYVGRKIA
jgi:hypothetical protein